ncbi:MAG: 23S rRNA (uracil(1939)-C(5))-methyltransferase RlmD [Leptospira sp.]|nr:23S rRNA (uracil(1939)-C(5))-methyltransferase RlmD [Leptospira sp.]
MNNNLCQHFGVCGGCTQLKTTYANQLKSKEKAIHSLFSKYDKTIIHPILPSPQELDYRHKIQLPFGRRKLGRKMLVTLGLHSKDNSFIVDQAECRIQDPGLTRAAQAVRQWARKENLSAYNEKSGSGILRHVVMRKSHATGEIIVAIVTNGDKLPGGKDVSKSLFTHLRSSLGKKSEFGKLVGIIQNVNSKNTHMVLGKDNHLLWGRPYILEKIGKFKFKVSITNFIQVNPYQTPSLYNIVLDHVDKGAKVIDAFAGMGTIGMWVSGQASQVICTEENPESFRTGLEAIRVNELKNVRFKKGRSEDVLPELLAQSNMDTLILDPPRIGLDDKTMDSILEHPVSKIIYVSCDPETLKRDMGRLKAKYNLTHLYPVDLFPQTDHLESVAILELR